MYPRTKLVTFLDRLSIRIEPADPERRAKRERKAHAAMLVLEKMDTLAKSVAQVLSDGAWKTMDGIAREAKIHVFDIQKAILWLEAETECGVAKSNPFKTPLYAFRLRPQSKKTKKKSEDEPPMIFGG